MCCATQEHALAVRYLINQRKAKRLIGKPEAMALMYLARRENEPMGFTGILPAKPGCVMRVLVMAQLL